MACGRTAPDGGVGALQDRGAGAGDLLGGAVADVGGGEQRDPAVMVLEVVPAEKPLAEAAGVLDAAEPVREGRVVLEGLELALGVGVVVGDVRAGVALGHAQVPQEQGDRLGGHRGAPVGVDGERAGLHTLDHDGLGEQPLGQGGGLAWATIHPTT